MVDAFRALAALITPGCRVIKLGRLAIARSIATPPDAIQKRGYWQALQFLRHHEKHGKLETCRRFLMLCLLSAMDPRS